MGIYTLLIGTGIISAAIALVIAGIVTFMLPELDDDFVHREKLAAYARKHIRSSFWVCVLSFTMAVGAVIYVGWVHWKNPLSFIHLLMLVIAAAWMIWARAYVRRNDARHAAVELDKKVDSRPL